MNKEKKPINTNNNYIFSEDTIDAIRELGSVLRSIHERLVREGYTIECGKVIKRTNDQFEQRNS